MKGRHRQEWGDTSGQLKGKQLGHVDIQEPAKEERCEARRVRLVNSWGLKLSKHFISD